MPGFYGLTWRVVDRKFFPSSKAKHRPALVVTTISPDPKPGKYKPHQGKRECARRVRQMEARNGGLV